MHSCTLLQDDFTAVPLLLVVLSSSKRIIRKCHSDMTVISCLFVGDLLRGVPDPVRRPEHPSSTLLRGISGNNNIEMV